jgi:hypothetical protein
MFAMATARIARTAAVSGLAAVAIMGAVAGPAAAAPVAPAAAAATSYWTETSLNSGKSLASNKSGFAVATPPNAADRLQHWEERFRGQKTLPNGVTGTGWELRNRDSDSDSDLCLQDFGLNQRVREVSCNSSSVQTWVETDFRNVNGKLYNYWLNAATGRALQLDSPTSGPFLTFTVIAANPAQVGSATSASQSFTDAAVT